MLMRKILSLVLLFCALFVNAQNSKNELLKVGFKGEINPFEVKIQKILLQENDFFVIGTIKQKENFSYMLNFDDCYIVYGNSDKQEYGNLVLLNKKRQNFEGDQSIGDKKETEFWLKFPCEEFMDVHKFTIKIGTIQNHKRTPIIFYDVPIKK